MTKAKRKSSGNSAHISAHGKQSVNGLAAGDVYARIANSPKGISYYELARDFGLTNGDINATLVPVLEKLAKRNAVFLDGKTLKATNPPSRLVVARVTRAARGQPVLLEPVNWDEDALQKPVLHLPPRAQKSGELQEGDKVLLRVKKRFALKPKDDGNGRKVRDAVYKCSIWQRLGDGQDAQITGVFKKTCGSGEVVTDAPMLKESFPIISKPKDLPLSGGERVIASLSSEFDQRRTKASVLGLIWDASQKVEKLSTRILVNAGIPLTHPHANDKNSKEKARTPIRSEGRTDYRSIKFVTIDGADAKDRDDAVYSEEDKSPDNPGGRVIYKAIADVSNFVLPGTPVDRHARHQMFSVYTYDRAAHMLPDVLSERACSLNAHRKRYAIVGKFRVDAEGRTISRSFERAIIKPVQNLTYDRVDQALSGEAPFPDELQRIVENLAATREVLQNRHGRRKDLDIADNKIVPDFADNGTIRGFKTERNSLSRDIIKKFAIMFNEEFGAELHAHDMPFIGRVQKAPERNQIKKARVKLEGLGIACPDHDKWLPEDLNDMMAQALGNDTLLFNVEQIILPMMMPAEYRFNGAGHYGLGFDDKTPYVPASSPIRRYADLYNHRSMGRLKGWYSGPLIENEDQVEMEPFVQGMTDAEWQYGKLQARSLQSLAIAHLHNKHDGQETTARIGRVSGRHGLKLFLSDCPMPFDLPMDKMPDGHYVRSADRLGMYNERLQRHFKMGDMIDVKIKEANPLGGTEGTLDFEIVTGEAPKPARRFTRIKSVKGTAAHSSKLKTVRVPARIVSADTKNGVVFEMMPHQGQKIETNEEGSLHRWPISSMPKGSYRMINGSKGLYRYPGRRIRSQSFVVGEDINLAVKVSKDNQIREVAVDTSSGEKRPQRKSVSVNSFAELKAAMERIESDAPSPD